MDCNIFKGTNAAVNLRSSAQLPESHLEVAAPVEVLKDEVLACKNNIQANYDSSLYLRYIFI
jgi:hypothetical protein